MQINGRVFCSLLVEELQNTLVWYFHNRRMTIDPLSQLEMVAHQYIWTHAICSFWKILAREKSNTTSFFPGKIVTTEPS